jgi:hypothetical protein
MCFFERFGRWPNKEHGLKTIWETKRDENGSLKHKAVGYKVGNVEIRA